MQFEVANNPPGEELIVHEPWSPLLNCPPVRLTLTKVPVIPFPGIALIVGNAVTLKFIPALSPKLPVTFTARTATMALVPTVNEAVTVPELVLQLGEVIRRGSAPRPIDVSWQVVSRVVKPVPVIWTNVPLGPLGGVIASVGANTCVTVNVVWT